MAFFDYFIRYYVNHQYGATYIITELVAALSVTLVFNRLKYRDYRSWLRILADFACTWVVYLFFSCFFDYLFPSLNGTLRLITWPLISALHAFYPREMKRRSRITCAFAIMTFIELSLSFSGSLGSMISFIYGYPDSQLTDTTMYVILVALIAVATLFGILSPFRYKYVKIVPTVLLNGIFSVSYIFTLLHAILMPGNVSDLNTDMSLIVSVMFLVLWILNFLSYIIFYSNVKAYNEILDYQMKALKNESERYQIEISNAKYEELHKLRHDLKNQMGLLSSLLREEKYDEMKKYLADLNEGAYIAMDFFETGNVFVSAILNMELSKAKSNGLKLEGKISVPKELMISSNDLDSLLCNAIDNAIEASVRYGIMEPIEISLLFEEPYLFLTVKNRVPDSLDHQTILRMKSQKNDRMNHGYGVKVIKDIVNRHHGSCRFEINDGYFTLDSMLLLDKVKEN